MITIIENKHWSYLQQYDWVADMHGVPQSPVHHAEGDVAIHTRMVLDALTSMPEYLALDEQQKEIVWVAALMHDVEKRSTTRTDEHGDIVSPGHSRKGSLTANAILYRQFNVPLHIRKQVVALVKYHGLPVWSLERADSVKTVIKVSLELDTTLLYLLAKADILGRICQDKQQLLERVEYYKELCIEQQCWGQAYSFGSQLARFTYFRKDDQSPAFVPFGEVGSNVIVMSGIAGSGKDHYLYKHCADMPVISLDNMRREQKVDHNDKKGNGRIIQQATELARQYLRKQQSFAWNATNITQTMREQLIDLLATYKASVHIVYVEVPYRSLLKQNRDRQYPIPESAIERMIDKLEVPALWEAHQVTYHSI